MFTDFADITSPLHKLLLEEKFVLLGTAQHKAFEKSQNVLTHLPVLWQYNPNCKTLVAADLSLYGLGAILIQRIEGKLKPISYASRSLTATEERYA